MNKNTFRKVSAMLALLVGWALIFPLGSFLIDPFLLVVLGILIVYVAARTTAGQAKRGGIVTALSLTTLGIFYICSVSLYFDLSWIAWMWKMGDATSGRDFMVNSWVLNIDYTSAPTLTHVMACVLFILYPLWLYLGVRLGYRVSERNERRDG